MVADYQGRGHQERNNAPLRLANNSLRFNCLDKRLRRFAASPLTPFITFNSILERGRKVLA
jgi:hypothetical protein